MTFFSFFTSNYGHNFPLVLLILLLFSPMPSYSDFYSNVCWITTFMPRQKAFKDSTFCNFLIQASLTNASAGFITHCFPSSVLIWSVTVHQTQCVKYHFPGSVSPLLLPYDLSPTSLGLSESHRSFRSHSGCSLLRSFPHCVSPGSFL